MTMLPTYFPSPSQGVWHLGPLPIRAYALFIIAGIVVALVIGDRRWVARGGQRGVIYDIALWAVPFGLIGGRLYHLATDWRTYFGPGGAGPAAALRIWDGGLGIWGAVALGAVGAWIACRRRGIPLPAFADAVAPGIILAQAIGRLGNYFNQELYGRETTLPWGLEIFYRRDPAGYIDPHSLDGVSTGQLALVVQPTFLYELIWNVLVFVALIYLDRRFSLGHGRLFAIYVAGYCVGRFCVELLRDDTATHIAGIRINSFTSTFVFIGAVVYLVLAPKGREDPASLRGTEYVDEELPEAEPEPADELAAVASASGAASGAAADAETTELEKATESKAAESKDREDEAVETEAVETEAVEAEVAEPETVKTQAAAEGDEAGDEESEAEVEESEVEEEAEKEAEPEPAEAEEPEAVADESESAEPEVAEAEAAVAEAERAEPDDAEAEAVVTEDAEAEAEEPEAEELEAEEPEAEELEAEEPEAEEPEAEEPEAEEPEAEEPEAETEEAEAETETEIDEVETEAEEPEAEDAEAEEPKSEEPQAESESAEPVAEDRGEPGEPASQAPADAGAAAKAESGSTRRRLRFRLRNRRDR
ncbi:prolipoprotein diacylglyceryl transferase [Mycobacterium sp. SP-6446]|nr:prolipoprotein diacylglyceryl transferase [Mycobacterium sp. SP-6446]OMC08488.1 prolipoprotein diacylglyceryl transferase [Mycobacterium sp. SP-6446]